MTIFQKMLVVPILSLAFYFILIVYSYSVQQESNEQLEQIRDHYMPLLAVANENSSLFIQISVILKDAVLANEVAWVEQTESLHQHINQNFTQLKQYPNIVAANKVDASINSFNEYYDSAKSLALNMLLPNASSLNLDEAINDANINFNASEMATAELVDSINESFYHTVDQTNQVMKKLLFWGGLVSVGLLLMFILITIGVSVSTKRNIHQVVIRMKSLAEGNPDFSQRINHNNKDEVGNLVYWFNQLSSKLEHDYQAIETLSRTDKLTQLHNRTSSDSYISELLKQFNLDQIPFSLIIVDIDHFKNVNDTYGHLAGDQVLQQFANILSHNTNDSQFVGRWGGEEFLILLPLTNCQQAEELANQLRLKIDEHKIAGLSITASFGVAQVAQVDSVDSIIKKADQALYEAKQQGRNQVVVFSS